MVKFKLDIIDRKIIYILSKNSRYSNTVIAKKIGSSREVVAYRLKKIQEGNIPFWGLPRSLLR